MSTAPPNNHAGLRTPEKNTVDVWSVDLTVADARVGELSAILSDAEKVRAATFVFARHHRRFVASHAALRLVLSKYCGLAPSALQFTGKQGEKPGLLPEQSFHQIEFNLSHSGERALIAVTSGEPVGIDIEAICAVPDGDETAKLWFAPIEHDQLARLPPSERQLGFLNLWTRKEAYIKAIGDGLVVQLDKFDVDLDSSRPNPVHMLTDRGRTRTDWWIYPLAPGNGYTGAVALRGEKWTLNHRTLEIVTDRVSAAGTCSGKSIRAS